MVLLRLSVNVYPREQLPSSSSFSIRSFLGDRENNGQSSSNSAAVKPARFLVILHDPEDVTLGGLAAIIHEKWRKLRPNADPLEIKKLVDDVRPSVDLDPDMTVADVWVDKGKARVEGHDQHAAVRVIQKPAPYAPVRFPSVEQDWDAAARAYEIQKQRQKVASVHKFPPIPEEPSRRSFADNHVAVERVENSQPEQSHPKKIVKGPTGLVEREDQPLSSVERDEVFAYQSRLNGASSQIWSDAPSDSGNLAPGRRMESQELGDFPGPAAPKPQAAVRNSVAEESKSESGSEYETDSEESSEESSDDSSDSDESEETGVPQGGKDTKGVKHSEDGEESDGSEETGSSESDESEEDENNTDVPMTDNTAAANQAPPPTNPPREVEIPSSNALEKESHVGNNHVHDRDVPMNDNAGVEEQTLPSTDPTREVEIPSSFAPEKETQNVNHHEQDGDVPMTDNMVDEKALPSTQQTREEEVSSSIAPEKEPQNNATPPMKLRLRKRKTSDHGVEPNKEPRLAPASSPVLQNGKNGSHVAEDDGVKPPSSTWNGFSRMDESNGNGKSVEQERLEPADPPQRKMSKIVKLPLPKASDKPVVPGVGEPAYTHPEHAMSPPAPGHQSPQPTFSQPLSQSTSTAKDQNGAAGIPKSTPSAIRKDTLNGKSERQSVSFADTQAPKSDTQPKSTPLRTNVPSTSSPSTSQPAASQQKSAMVYPPGVTPEMVNKITKEAEEKQAKQDQQTAEYKRKIKAAKEQYPDSEYLRQLREVCKIWESLLAAEKDRKCVSSVKRLRIRYADETKRLEMTEACIKPLLLKPHDSPEPSAAPKRAASREEAGRPEPVTTVATRNFRGDSATPNKPVSKTSPSGATPLGRTRSQSARQTSVDPGGQATTNQTKSLTSPETKKPDGTKSHPLNLESDSEYEQEESEPESESESESESENTDLEILKVMPSSQPVEKPASSNPWSRTPPSVNPRTSLKSLLDDQKSNQAVRQSTQPANQPTTRKSVFSPSLHGADDSGDDDESESDSDSNSDEGDITASGHIQRLRRARPKA